MNSKSLEHCLIERLRSEYKQLERCRISAAEAKQGELCKPHACPTKNSRRLLLVNLVKTPIHTMHHANQMMQLPHARQLALSGCSDTCLGIPDGWEVLSNVQGWLWQVEQIHTSKLKLRLVSNNFFMVLHTRKHCY